MAVVALDEDSMAALSKDARVLRVEDDAVVEALEATDNGKQAKSNSKKRPSQPAEVLPWGINKIDAELVWFLGGVGAGVNVGVIDTGISSSHPDLVGNIKGGVSEVGYTSSWNDDNGHGSHVAGIIGAIDNDIGVIGASYSANLYAIKVLDRRGSGYLSDVINGVDWAVANGMQVVNLSLGCDCSSESLHDAVIRARCRKNQPPRRQSLPDMRPDTKHCRRYCQPPPRQPRRHPARGSPRHAKTANRNRIPSLN